MLTGAAQFIKCPKCKKEMHRQGLGGHLRFSHNIRVPKVDGLIVDVLSTEMFDLEAKQLAGILLKLFNGDARKLISQIKKLKGIK